MKPRVSLEELSRLLDGELDPGQRTDVQRRLQACELSRALYARLQGLTTDVARTMVTAPATAAAAAGTSCLKEEALVRIAEGLAAPEEEREVERHLAQCTLCMRRVLAYLGSSEAMRSASWPGIPAEVAQQALARILLHARERQEDDEVLETITLDLEQEQDTSHTCGWEELNVTAQLSRVAPARARVQIMIKEHLRPKTGQAVVITNLKTRRKVFTGETDAHGRLVVERLPSGSYVAHLVGSDLKLEINVQGG